MRFPRQTLVYGLVLLLAIISSGAPLGVLQMVANASMIMSSLQEDGLKGSFEKTFSGESPCELCKFVERVQEVAGLNASDDAVAGGSEFDFKFVAVQGRDLCPPRGALDPLHRQHSRFESCRRAPATPPPRLS